MIHRELLDARGIEVLANRCEELARRARTASAIVAPQEAGDPAAMLERGIEEDQVAYGYTCELGDRRAEGGVVEVVRNRDAQRDVESALAEREAAGISADQPRRSIPPTRCGKNVHVDVNGNGLYPKTASEGTRGAADVE